AGDAPSLGRPRALDVGAGEQSVMSVWTLILFAAVCFGASFALAHFTERLLFSAVGSAGQRRESSPTRPIVDEAGAHATSRDEVEPANAAASSAATSGDHRQSGLERSPDSEPSHARVHQLRRAATARNFRSAS